MVFVLCILKQWILRKEFYILFVWHRLNFGEIQFCRIIVSSEVACGRLRCGMGSIEISNVSRYCAYLAPPVFEVRHWNLLGAKLNCLLAIIYFKNLEFKSFNVSFRSLINHMLLPDTSMFVRKMPIGSQTINEKW